MKTIKELGDFNFKYDLKIREIFGIKRSVLFWKYIDFIACKMDKLAKLYENTVGKEYKKEIEKFNLKNDKKILHIGCGAYPISALMLASLDNVEIVAIDSNYKAIKLAHKIIQKKNLENKIKVEYGDGTNYPLDGFDTIIISGCSIPKIKVLNHIIKNAKSDSKIIIRESFLNIESIINNLATNQNLIIKEKIKNHAFTNSNWTSYCFLKK
ncbi:MAG: methyltransferase [Candidatus Thermoplasmatota archaeon]|jgi:precorrin-6B methylase 2|nr:methyltransferase [Candidatus Thermoplasmatota archaeon]